MGHIAKAKKAPRASDTCALYDGDVPARIIDSRRRGTHGMQFLVESGSTATWVARSLLVKQRREAMIEEFEMWRANFRRRVRAAKQEQEKHMENGVE